MKYFDLRRDPTESGKKEWYLQKAPYKSGAVFWDSYLHYECKLIRTTTENPFDKQKQKILSGSSRETDKRTES